MEKGKRLKSVNGETDQLPEVMIQHIQSFLSGKEAARTTILSKAWYTAWSTRPTLDFDPNDFRGSPKSNERFAEYAMKSLQRYQDSNLKIDSFRLRMHRFRFGIVESIAKKLVVKAMKLGATDLNLEFSSNRSILPREVLESETLVRLSVSKRTIDGSIVKCLRLKSLVLDNVHMRSDMFKDVITCCKLLEELSITDRNNKQFSLSEVNLFELHELRHLYVERVVVDPSFFTNFASRFPCLKNLSLVCCSGIYSWVQISSSSLERLKIEVPKYGKALAVLELLVPNLVHFRYSGERDMPSFMIQSSREWESHITIRPSRPDKPSSLYFRLKTLLSDQLGSSKKSVVSMIVGRSRSPRRVYDEEGVIEAVHEPLAVDNLTIDPPFASSYTLLVGLFMICRPTMLTVVWPCRYWNRKDEFIGNVLYKRLMKEMISPNCGIPDQDIFGQIGLKEVSVDGYKKSRESEEWEAVPPNEGIEALTAPRLVEMLFIFKLRWG